MGNIGPGEILVILVAALIILGPKRLPEAARQMGKAMAEFRRVSSGLQSEMRDAFSEPGAGTGPSTPSATEPKESPSVIEPVVQPPIVDAAPATPADSEVHLPPDDPSLL